MEFTFSEDVFRAKIAKLKANEIILPVYRQDETTDVAVIIAKAPDTQSVKYLGRLQLIINAWQL